MKKILSRLFKTRQSELNLVLLSLLHSFFIGMSQVFTGTTANTLFLVTFDAKLLPLVYIASSLAVPMLGMVFIRMERRVSFGFVSRLIISMLITVPVVFLAFFLAIPGFRVLPFILLVWVDVEIILSDLVFWTTANRLFNIRQAKRLFGIIGSGQVVAFIASGALIPVLVRHLDVPVLLSVSAAGHIATLCIFIFLSRHGGQEKDAKPDAEPSRIPLSGFLNKKYFRSIFLMVGLGYLVYYFVDLSFYDLSQSSLNPGQELASFLGIFWSVVGMGNLFMRTVVYGRWTAATGIKGGLLAGPVLIGMGGIAAAFLSAFNPAGSLVFIAVVMTKYLERVLINSMYVPAYFTLFQPLEENIRDRLQNFTETVIGQGAGGIAGLILLFLFNYFVLPPAVTHLLLLLVVCIWIFSILRMSRGYRSSLTEALRTMGMKGRELSLSGRDVDYLKGGLRSENPLMVKACLSLLGNKTRISGAEKILLINNKSPLVQEEICARLVREPDPVLLPELLRHFNMQPEKERFPGLVEAMAATGEEGAYGLLSKLAKGRNVRLRDEAVFSLLKYFPTGHVCPALTRSLHDWAVSRSVKRRMSAASILPKLRDEAFIPDVSSLLNDKDAEVRKSAVASLSPNMVPAHFETLFRIMNDPLLETSVIRIISGTDEDITHRLEAVYNGTEDRSRKRDVIRIYRKQVSPGSQYLLRTKLEEEDSLLRAEILYALQSCGYKAQTHDIALLQRLLESERELCCRLFSAVRVLDGEAHGLLIDGLKHEINKSVERIFLILTFINPSEDVIVVLNNLSAKSEEKRAFALELADTVLSSVQKSLVFPMIEDIPLDRRIDLLKKNSRNLRFPGRDELLDVIGRGEWGKWLKTCVRYERGEEQARALVRRVEILRKAELFSEIPDEKLAALAGAVRELEYDEGGRIITKGEDGTSMYILARGRVSVHDGPTVFTEIGEGSFFGELAALSPEPRSASITGITATRLFNIEQNDLIDFLKSNLDVGRAIISVLCRRIREAQSRKEPFMPRSDVVEKGCGPSPTRSGESDLLKKLLVLKSQPEFYRLPVVILTEAAARARRLDLGEGCVLFKKHERSSHLFIVCRGELVLESGGRLVQRVGEHGIVGELSALDSQEREASALAVRDSEVLQISRRTLNDLMWNQYDLVESMLHVLIARLRWINRS